MNFQSSDVSRLLIPGYIRPLRSAPAARAFLCEAVNLAEELNEVLRRYPQERYEPLDLHYVILQSLTALSEPLIEDLMGHYGEFGVIWASLLVALKPSPTFAKYFAEIRQPLRPSQWLSDVARVACGGAPFTEQPLELLKLIHRLARLLTPVHRPSVVLRVEPSPEFYALRQVVVGRAYRTGGLDAALLALKNYH